MTLRAAGALPSANRSVTVCRPSATCPRPRRRGIGADEGTTRSVTWRPSTAIDTTADSAPARAQDTPGADAAKEITASPSRPAVKGSDRAGPPRWTMIAAPATWAGAAARAGVTARARGAPARAAPVMARTA
ncbi:hypothetical protein [Actinomadura madurae]|uniref:hypothetical protein n=1 Tax=Actinomadura madurae TaxID=1993 RepID=UPI0020D2193F|nr:hypothetical protein [Actinomadura madurae]MCQ0020070.1 hypothetical protein [Actinomadura madurae]